MELIRLRDKRKPGHAWQDNELYDCFGPIIGAHAQLVYVHLTRHGYGAEVLCRSSRELAEACELSNASVWRAMKVMELVGMVRLQPGGKGRQMEYGLVDLKELAEALGASYRNGVASLPPETVQRMRKEVGSLRANFRKSRGGSVSLGNTSEAADGVEGVSLGNSSVSPGNRSVSPEPENGGAINYSRQQDTKLNPSPLPPSRGEGGVVAMPVARQIKNQPAEAVVLPPFEQWVGEDPARGRMQQQQLVAMYALLLRRTHGQRAEDDRALEVQALPAVLLQPPEESASLEELLDWVMASCCFAHDRVRRALRKAVLCEAAGPARRTAALAMAAAWRDYVQRRAVLRDTWSPPTFFAYGHWRHPESWRVDAQALDRARRASGY